MGLSVAVGCAYGLRLKENPRSRVFCILGMGNSMKAMSGKLPCLPPITISIISIAVVDYNKVMAKGFVWDLMNIEPSGRKMACIRLGRS